MKSKHIPQYSDRVCARDRESKGGEILNVAQKRKLKERKMEAAARLKYWVSGRSARAFVLVTDLSFI